jgi:hypothetical protein
MITAPEQAVNAATCALSRISTFKSQGQHTEGCPWCAHEPRELCRMVAAFMDTPENAAAIRLYENRQSQSLMESMWR